MLTNLIIAITVIIAVQHLSFLWLEMFAWETWGKKIFRIMPPELFNPTKKMAANQGLYNGFLAAGLIWSVFIENVSWAINIRTFFFICVALAGIYGGYSVSRKIFIVQAIPALFGLILIFLKNNSSL